MTLFTENADEGFVPDFSDEAPPPPRRRRSCLFRLIAVALSLLLGCGLLEAGTRLLLNQARRASAADPESPYSLYMPHPTYDWTHVPNRQIVIDEIAGVEPFPALINSTGLRDHEYAITERAPGSFRVLVIGDSFIESLQVPLEVRAFQALEDRYNGYWLDDDYEIIEAGVARWSPVQYDLYYTSEGRAYNPDVVIVAITTGSDIREMFPPAGQDEIDSLARQGHLYTLVDDQLKLVPANRWHPPRGSSRVPVSSPLTLRLRWWLLENSRVYERFDARLVNSEGGRSFMAGIGALDSPMPLADQFERGSFAPRDAQTLPIFEAVIVALRDAVEADGATFAVVTIPQIYAVHQDWYFEDYPDAEVYRDQFDANKVERQINAILERNNIRTFSLTPYLQAAAESGHEPLYYRDNTHWTPAGHRVVTEALDLWFNNMGWAAQPPN